MISNAVRRAEMVFRDREVLNLPVSALWNEVPSEIRDLLFGIWNNSAVSITSADSEFTVSSLHRGGTIVITGTAPGEIRFGSPSAYHDRHQNVIVNKSTRRWIVHIDGISDVWLWPDQSVTVINCAGGLSGITGARWHHSPMFRWMPDLPAVASTRNINVDYINGNDANDGLATGAGNALKTIAEAARRIQYLYDGSFNIQLAGGTHNVGSGLFVNSVTLGHDQFTITGDVGSPSSYVIQCDAGGTCLSAQDGAIVTINGVMFTTLGSGSTAVHARQGATVDTNVVIFHNFPAGTHIRSTTWASINVLSNYSIFGGGAFHVYCSENAYVNYGSFTVDIPVATVFTTFLRVENCGVVSNGGVPMTFTGAGATGKRYSIDFNAVARIGVTLPGDVAGTTSTGGQYV